MTAVPPHPVGEAVRFTDDEREFSRPGSKMMFTTATRVKISAPRKTAGEAEEPMLVVGTYEPDEYFRYPVQNRVIDARGRVGWLASASLRRL